MIINNTSVEPDHYYRIENNFDGSNKLFWYHIHNNKKELNSHCTEKDSATVYKGNELIEIA